MLINYQSVVVIFIVGRNVKHINSFCKLVEIIRFSKVAISRIQILPELNFTKCIHKFYIRFGGSGNLEQNSNAVMSRIGIYVKRNGSSRLFNSGYQYNTR